jgi:sugar phosphate isomerase/epimerase
MLLGTLSHLFRGSPAAVAVVIQQHGLRCVQLTPSFPRLRFQQPIDITADRCRQAAQPFLDAGLHIACLTGSTNLVEPDLDRRHRGLVRLHALLRHCRDFGTAFLVTETGNPLAKGASFLPPNRAREVWAELLLIVAEAVRIAADSGVTLLLKPGPGQVLATATDALRLRQELPQAALGFVLDPAVFLLESRPETVSNELARLVEALGPWTPIVHAKDLRFHADGVTLPHVGRGVLDYGVLLRTLRRYQAEPAIILEHLRPEEVAAAKARMLAFDSRS